VWNLILAQAKDAVPAQVAPAAEEAAKQSTGAGAGAGAGSPLGGMLPMIVAMIAIFYFLMIRPQQKRDKERRLLLSSIAKGDKVLTSGGICGTVSGLTESNVVLKVDDNTKIEFVRSAVVQILSREGETKK
jgi:preprotein translocase subunit YajC